MLQKSLELRFGRASSYIQEHDGHVSVLLDLIERKLYPYSSIETSDLIHERFEGRRYYQSHSGRSGRGWVPATLRLRLVTGYRADLFSVSIPSREGTAEILLGVRLAVPYSYREGDLSPSWPLVGWVEGEAGPYLFDLKDLERFLLQRDGFENMTWTCNYIPCPGGSASEVFKAPYIAREGQKGIGKALMALHRNTLRFDTRGFEEEVNATDLFWTGLGLVQIEDRLYRVSKGICRASYPKEAQHDKTLLQEIAPSNVTVLRHNIYVQAEQDRYVARGLFYRKGVEIELTAPEYVTLLNPWRWEVDGLRLRMREALKVGRRTVKLPRPERPAQVPRIAGPVRVQS